VRQAFHVVVTTGRIRSETPEPTSGPTTGLPSNVDQSELVSSSNINLFDWYNRPLVPNRKCLPAVTLSNGMTVPHNVQYTIVRSTPPTRSRAISCHARIRFGYARASPFTNSPTTFESFRYLAADAGITVGDCNGEIDEQRRVRVTPAGTDLGEHEY
jgi:hypothetical protein